MHQARNAMVIRNDSPSALGAAVRTADAAMLSRSVHPDALARHDLTWRTQSTCPRDWWANLLRCGGGFFHSQAGVEAVVPQGGETVFAELRHGDEVVGIAAGVRSRCRFSVTARHVYLPTPPALICGSRRGAALEALREALRDQGDAELAIDAFDARWDLDPSAGLTAESRIEYLVPLELHQEDMRRRLVHHHRRRVARGDQEGWVLRLHSNVGPERAAEPAGAASPAPVRGFSGWLTTVLCTGKDGVPIAGALLGVAGRRAYCLRSWATPDGEARGAAVWLQWRIMCHLPEVNVDVYNLGFTPATAVAKIDPAHELFRFRSGFSPELVRCRPARWPLGAGHMRAHGAAQWLAHQLLP